MLTTVPEHLKSYQHQPGISGQFGPDNAAPLRSPLAGHFTGRRSRRGPGLVLLLLGGAIRGNRSLVVLSVFPPALGRLPT